MTLHLVIGRVTSRQLPVFPVADFTANVTNGLFPLAVKFTDTSTGTEISAWNWDFNNDGSVDSIVQSPEYTYNTAGMYTVNLTITGTAGSDSEVKSNYIMAIVPTLIPTPMLPPVAIFTFGLQIPYGVIFPHFVTAYFYDNSTNTPTEWNWSFTNVTGNNTQVWFSTGQNPVHIFGTGELFNRPECQQ